MSCCLSRLEMNAVNSTFGTPARSRWLPMLVLTFLVNLNSAVFFPNYVTDAFRWGAFLLCFPPIVWAGYLLFRYQTRGERIVTYLGDTLGALLAAAGHRTGLSIRLPEMLS
jgi:hypothetical protein